MVKAADDIPRGNTCPGVNRAVIEWLLSTNGHRANLLLDVPCGKGEFLDAVKGLFPGWRLTGADVKGQSNSAHEFYRFDATTSGGLECVSGCDIVTCISGVMEFDNTLGFFRKLYDVSADGVTLIVTNDNLLTVRDRLLFLLFGRFRQYTNIPSGSGPTWKVLHLSSLVRILADAGFKINEIRYVIGGRTEWLWLPLALPIYVIELLYRSMGDRHRRGETQYFPFRSLIARHYLLICGKKSELIGSLTRDGSR